MENAAADTVTCPQTPWEILEGDAEAVLKTLPAASIHCCVTSPPYFGLRDYGHAGQVGQERRPEQFIRRLVEVFRATRRVLRDDGTLWVNIGDCFANDGMDLSGTAFKKKDLLLIPFRLAAALQEDGWYLRTDIIWNKKNCTPESARDRPTRSHEYLFLLSKKPRYYYDHVAVLEPNEGKPPAGRKASTLANKARMANKALRDSQTGFPRSSVNLTGTPWADNVEAHGGFVAHNPRGRRQRSVWRLPVSCFFPEKVGISDVKHFAVMPPGLVIPCIAAGTSEAGCCARCAAPFRRVVEAWEDLEDTWAPSCGCPPAEPVPCTVMDIFSGSGTVGVVSREMNRFYKGIELNPD